MKKENTYTMIIAQGITKTFGELQVLKGVDLTVEKGEVVSIVGASGAGKSTLLQILGTLSRPDSGTLLIDGCDPFVMGDRKLSAFRGRKLGFVFQFHHLLPEFTALENVMMPALIASVSSAEASRRAASLLESVGLAGRMSHKPSELSGGEQQRVAIARALVNSPAVVLADEPTGNLDSATKIEIQKLFLDLRDSLGQTFVIVTHDEALAAACDRSLKMKDGLFVTQ